MFIIEVQRDSHYDVIGTYGRLSISDSDGRNLQLHSTTKEPCKPRPAITYNHLGNPHDETPVPEDRPKHKPKWYPDDLCSRIPAGSYQFHTVNTNQIDYHFFNVGSKPDYEDVRYLFEIDVKKWEGCYIVEGDMKDRLLVPKLQIFKPTGAEYVSLWDTVIELQEAHPAVAWRIRFKDEPED